MSKLMPENRYRLVELKSGKVMMVFQTYPEMNPVSSCREACRELDLDLDVGFYRLDRMKKNSETGAFRWVKIYKFSLELG
jgi:hypothetical protein